MTTATTMRLRPASRTMLVHLPPRPRTHDDPVDVQDTLALDLGPDAHSAPPLPPATPELDPERCSRERGEADVRLRRWVARMAQAAVETAAGQRPASQLVRWTTPEVHRDLTRRGRAVAAVGAPLTRRIQPQVRSIHACRPALDAVEASVHVRHGERSRAVAMRLEERDGRWICVALEFG